MANSGSSANLSFGKTVRLLREEQGITLRGFAERVGMSPTYLSKVERGDFPPPAEDKIRAIAMALDQNPDEMLALAGRVSSDLRDIIRQQPRPLATFLRASQNLSAVELENLIQDTRRRLRRKSEVDEECE